MSGVVNHGTIGAYTNHACSCEDCLRAWREHAAEQRSKAVPLQPNDSRHGTQNAYTNLLCRCDACRQAMATYQAKYYAERRKASR